MWSSVIQKVFSPGWFARVSETVCWNPGLWGWLLTGITVSREPSSVSHPLPSLALNFDVISVSHCGTSDIACMLRNDSSMQPAHRPWFWLCHAMHITIISLICHPYSLSELSYNFMTNLRNLLVASHTPLFLYCSLWVGLPVGSIIHRMPAGWDEIIKKLMLVI